MKFISFNIEYLVVVAYSIEYRLKRNLQIIAFCFYLVLHNVPTSLELGL